MATEVERNWTAHLVISCEHAGLKPYFQAFEDELRRVLARIDEPKAVVTYLNLMRAESESILRKWEYFKSIK